MAATAEQIMDGLATRLQTISGLRVTDYIPGQVTPPAAVIGVPGIQQYHGTMGNGVVVWSPMVTVFTSTAWDRFGQNALAEYMSPTGAKSIRAAIEADRTLGGVVSDCVVMSAEAMSIQQFAAIGYYGGQWTLQCIATGV